MATSVGTAVAEGSIVGSVGVGVLVGSGVKVSAAPGVSVGTDVLIAVKTGVLNGSIVESSFRALQALKIVPNIRIVISHIMSFLIVLFLIFIARPIPE
ncbi:MAG: hypothetical protein ABIG63_11525 [Chloroflexota bacterium]